MTSSLSHLFQQALALERSHQNEAALAIYQQILAKHPDHLASRYNMGCLLAKLQQWSAASQALHQVVTQQADCTPAYYNLAIVYQALKDDTAAIACLEQTLFLNPEHPLAAQALGSLLLKQKNDTAAKKYLLQALQENPNDPDILFNMGLALLGEGNSIEALYYFTQLRDLQAHHVEASYNCGVIYQQAGNHAAALRAYQQVLHYHPQHFASLYNSGLIYQFIQQYSQALTYYEKALQIEPENKSLKFLIAALKSENISDMPKDHIKNLFDQYASHYETHMQQQLHYAVPKHLFNLFEQNCKTDPHSLCLVDLGCGTGLVGKYFQTYCHTLIGVDVSANMLAIAASKYCYTTVTQQDNVEYLNKVKNDVNIIVAADVLGYYGDLTHLFAACHAALYKQGYFLFSIENHQEDVDFILRPHARFTHQLSYIQKLAAQYKFKIVASEERILRYQEQIPVLGQLFLLQILD